MSVVAMPSRRDRTIATANEIALALIFASHLTGEFQEAFLPPSLNRAYNTLMCGGGPFWAHGVAYKALVMLTGRAEVEPIASEWTALAEPWVDEDPAADLVLAWLRAYRSGDNGGWVECLAGLRREARYFRQTYRAGPR